jgi:hypothetical protein
MGHQHRSVACPATGVATQFAALGAIGVGIDRAMRLGPFSDFRWPAELMMLCFGRRLAA